MRSWPSVPSKRGHVHTVESIGRMPSLKGFSIFLLYCTKSNRVLTRTAVLSHYGVTLEQERNSKRRTPPWTDAVPLPTCQHGGAFHGQGQAVDVDHEVDAVAAECLNELHCSLSKLEATESRSRARESKRRHCARHSTAQHRQVAGTPVSKDIVRRVRRVCRTGTVGTRAASRAVPTHPRTAWLCLQPHCQVHKIRFGTC